MRIAPHTLRPRLAEGLDEANVSRATLRRAWAFSRRFQRMIVVYLATIVVVAGLVGRARAPAADGQPYTRG